MNPFKILRELAGIAVVGVVAYGLPDVPRQRWCPSRNARAMPDALEAPAPGP